MSNGQNGHRFFTGSQPEVGESFEVIHAISDTTLTYTSLTGLYIQGSAFVQKGDAAVSGLDLKAGDKIFGWFNEVTSTGDVLCYLK